jgi:hypothetical protein
MSFNRKNIVWQSHDGTWNRAFYEPYYINEDSQNFCPEDDVDYHNRFDWVSTGHATADDAVNAWDGANPGGHWTIGYGDPEYNAMCDELDALAITFRESEAKDKAERLEKTLRAYFP